jgi:hypothetical protein
MERSYPTGNQEVIMVSLLDWVLSMHLSLVRNFHSGNIGPQYYVVFDNWFETVTCNTTEAPPEWEVLVMHSWYQAQFDDDDLQQFELDSEWLTKEELAEQHEWIKSECDMVWEQWGKAKEATSIDWHPMQADLRKSGVPKMIPEGENTLTLGPLSPVIPTTVGTHSERETQCPSDMSPLINITCHVGVET